MYYICCVCLHKLRQTIYYIQNVQIEIAQKFLFDVMRQNAYVWTSHDRALEKSKYFDIISIDYRVLVRRWATRTVSVSAKCQIN